MVYKDSARKMRHDFGGEYEPPIGAEAETEPGSGGHVLRNHQHIRSETESDI
jgi:hypothetical protein